MPLVLDNTIESLQKTKQAIAALKNVGAYADVEKAKASKKLRAGKGKLRNRRHTQRRGPLIVYGEDAGLVKVRGTGAGCAHAVARLSCDVCGCLSCVY